MKVAFILQVSSHARYLRRIDKLKEIGIKSQVFAFERNFYKGKVEDREYISLEDVEQENYFKRLGPLIKSVFKLKKQLDSPDVIYTFGVDTFIMGWIACLFKKKRPIMIYEVGDIRSVLVKNNLAGKLFRFIEKVVLKRMDLLVVTSESFVEKYFEDIQGIKNIQYHVIENKPELYVEKIIKNDSQLSENNKITIGYFGVLRCRRSLEILKEIMIKHGDRFNLYIRGISTGTNDLIEDIKGLDGVKVEGEYTVPDDLYEMYMGIDIIWACYPYQGEQKGNWNWAKTTRFYEACFFQKPMITQDNTQDAKFVLEYGIGIALNLSDIGNSINKILNISQDNIEKMNKKYKDVPSDKYIYTDEHSQLLEKIKLLIQEGEE